MAKEQMTYRDAFIHLRARVYALQRIPLGACTRDERAEEEALLIALAAMKDLSGCFHPDEMIQEEIPTSRQ